MASLWGDKFIRIISPPRLVPLAFGKGLSLKAILSVTGTFDVEKFNRGFEEDTRKFLSEQETEKKELDDPAQAFESETIGEQTSPISLGRCPSNSSLLRNGLVL